MLSDTIAEEARLQKVMAAIVVEFARQRVANELAGLGFDLEALARVAMEAADGEVVQFPPPLAP